MYIDDFRSGYYSNRNPLSFPPGVGPDAAYAGLNVLHTDRGTWIRKPGMSRWSTENVGSDTPLTFFSYTEGTTQHVIVDGRNNIREYTPSSQQVLWGKGGTGNQVSFAAVASVMYAVSNSVGNTRRKRVGSGNFKSWGITAPESAPSFSVNTSSGPRLRFGWKYRIVFKDSSDGHISSASPASISTGAQEKATVNLSFSGTDQSRVDKIDIYRTRDGGSSYYYLTTITNAGLTTHSYSDSNPDASLVGTLVCPSETDNNVPPFMVDLVPHVGRLFGITESGAVRASSHLVDNGLLNGVAEECWPPKLEWLFNSPVALLSTQAGLLIFTRSGEIHLLLGSSRHDFDPEQIGAGIPIASKNCVAQDGADIYVYTTTKEILGLGSDGIRNIGAAISSEDLEDFDPETSYLTVHREGNKPSLYLSNGNNKMFCYNIFTGTWSPVWEVDGTTVTLGAIKAVQSSLNGFDLFMAPKSGVSGYIWKQDRTTHLNDSVPFESYVQFGSYALAPMDEIALEYVTTEASVRPTVTVLIGEISGTPAGTTKVENDPPLQSAPSSYFSNRHWLQQSNFSRVGKHCQVRVAWGAADDAAELYTFSLGYVRTK